MSIVKNIIRKTRSLARQYGASLAPGGAEKSQREVCEMLESYYNSNDLYQNVQAALRELGQWAPSMKPMRNPTSAVVEFYAATVWPGKLATALPIVAENPAVVRAVEDIWHRSNWETRKQLALRQAAITGDMFLRVAQTEQGRKPFIQAVLTKDVADWREDDAGNIVWLRYEVKRRAESGDRDQSDYYHVEIWDKAAVATYKHRYGYNATMQQLGAPVSTVQHGIGFVPWVRGCFRDVGEAFGYPPIWVALDKIDEANMKATRLSELLFRWNKAFLAMKANMVDAQGRPMPPPSLVQDGVAKSDAETLFLRDNGIIKLPGMSSLESMVPDIKWDAHATALLADLDELKQDLPEIRFYELMQQSSLSGVALAYMMAPAICRALEVRGNLERALVRVNMMAITVGQREGMYLDAGRYENGETSHYFKDRDVIPMTYSERVDMAVKHIGAGVPLAIALQRDEGNWTETDLAGLSAAAMDEKVASAGMTAGPAADVLTQSLTRTGAKDALAPNLEEAISKQVGGSVSRALDSMTASLAEFLSGRTGGSGGSGGAGGGRATGGR